MNLLEYLNLIPSANREQPAFIASLSVGLSAQVRIQDVLQSMVPLFDVDTAIGDQLDTIGIWVGVSREVAVPISGVYFTWDGAASVGWDYGTWRPADAPAQITSLPDDAYRTLIKFKIAANHWDGTTDGAYAIWELLFPSFIFLIQDNQDMTYGLAIIGGIIDSLTLALITGGAIALKPEGVRINEYYVSVDDGPIFTWDLDDGLLRGWDVGSWVRELPPTV